VPVAEFAALDVLWIALSVFLVLVGLGLVYVLIRLGATIKRLTSFIEGLEMEVVPLVHKAGGTVDRVNLQLDKLDQVTDSAVDAADNVDTAVRAVSLAITRPVQKLSGFAEGLAHGLAALRSRRSLRSAYHSGKAAAARREHEIAEELEHGSEDL
jgi:uncharacterized protein YoxC